MNEFDILVDRTPPSIDGIGVDRDDGSDRMNGIIQRRSGSKICLSAISDNILTRPRERATIPAGADRLGIWSGESSAKAFPGIRAAVAPRIVPRGGIG